MLQLKLMKAIMMIILNLQEIYLKAVGNYVYDNLKSNKILIKQTSRWFLFNA